MLSDMLSTAEASKTIPLKTLGKSATQGVFKCNFITDKKSQDDEMLCIRSSCHRLTRLDDADMHKSPESKRSN